MVIQNSEVNMTSKSSFSATTKVNYQMTHEPAIKLGDITFKMALLLLLRRLKRHGNMGPLAHMAYVNRC